MRRQLAIVAGLAVAVVIACSMLLPRNPRPDPTSSRGPDGRHSTPTSAYPHSRAPIEATRTDGPSASLVPGPERTPVESETDNATLVVSVLTTEGRPIVGATVTVRTFVLDVGHELEGPTPLQALTTDAAGRVVVRLAPQVQCCISAACDGFVSAYRHGLAPGGSVTMRLDEGTVVELDLAAEDATPVRTPVSVVVRSWKGLETQPSLYGLTLPTPPRLIRAPSGHEVKTVLAISAEGFQGTYWEMPSSPGQRVLAKVTLSRGVSIRGRVQEAATEVPILGAQCVGDPNFGEAISDRSGLFETVGRRMTNGKAQLIVTHRDYCPLRLEIAGDENLLIVSLHPGDTRRVRVVDAVSHRPVAEAVLLLQRYISEEDVGAPMPYPTSADGVAVLRGLERNGVYRMTVHATGFMTTFAAFHLANESPVEADIVLNVPPVVEVVARLVDGKGQPIAGVVSQIDLALDRVGLFDTERDQTRTRAAIARSSWRAVLSSVSGLDGLVRFELGSGVYRLALMDRSGVAPSYKWVTVPEGLDRVHVGDIVIERAR